MITFYSVLTFLLYCTSMTATKSVSTLKGYNVTLSDTSISGFSSGGFMAVQFHLSHSGVLRGAGIIAGGPYYCAEGSLQVATEIRLNETHFIDVDKLINIAKRAAQQGDIDDTSFLEGSRVYLVSANKDTIVKPDIMEKVYHFYSSFVSPENLGRNYSIPAAHAQLTDDYGDQCDASNSPYIDNCNYPSGYIILQHIYGDIEYANSSSMITANLMEFDQSEFFGGDPSLFSMDDVGFLYVPTECQNGAGCQLHVMLHGCKQGRSSIGDVFALHAGYNGVAEVNNIIVLYPQVTDTLLINPKGCWDWWGYTGKDYCNKNGPQVSGIRQMMNRLSGYSSTEVCDADDNFCS